MQKKAGDEHRKRLIRVRTCPLRTIEPTEHAFVVHQHHLACRRDAVYVLVGSVESRRRPSSVCVDGAVGPCGETDVPRTIEPKEVQIDEELRKKSGSSTSRAAHDTP